MRTYTANSVWKKVTGVPLQQKAPVAPWAVLADMQGKGSIFLLCWALLRWHVEHCVHFGAASTGKMLAYIGESPAEAISMVGDWSTGCMMTEWDNGTCPAWRREG